MPREGLLSAEHSQTSPDYLGLVKFLVSPLLDSSDTLSIDCEHYHHNQRVWIRLAVTGTAQGKVYGRGGRNIQAIKTVVETAALAAGQLAHLDIYGYHENTSERYESESGGKPGRRKRSARRLDTPKSLPKPRPR